MVPWAHGLLCGAKLQHVAIRSRNYLIKADFLFLAWRWERWGACAIVPAAQPRRGRHRQHPSRCDSARGWHPQSPARSTTGGRQRPPAAPRARGGLELCKGEEIFGSGQGFGAPGFRMAAVCPPVEAGSTGHESSPPLSLLLSLHLPVFSHPGAGNHSEPSLPC